MRFDTPSEPSPLASAQSGEPPYTPNHISLETRAWYLVASTLLIIYASASLWVDDLYIWIASIGAAAAAAFVVLGLLARGCIRKPDVNGNSFGLSWRWCFQRSGYNEQGQRLCTWGAVSLALFVVCTLVGALLSREH
jgi:hypothetical protein